MSAISLSEQTVVDAAASAPMLAQVERWAAVNSGSRNLAGLGAIATLLADAFASLPGTVALIDPAPVDAVAADGRIHPLDHGHHLHVCVRPDAPVQLLLTGHMDTVFAVDDSFQSLRWLEPGVLNGPGVADMKSGIAIMLAALNALERSPAAARIGYDVVINSDEEVGSPSSAALIARTAQGKRCLLYTSPSPRDKRQSRMPSSA